MVPEPSPKLEVRGPKSVDGRVLPAPGYAVPEPEVPGGTHEPAAAPRFRPGDPVLTRGEPAVAVGKIDAVLGARSGERLVVERAYQSGRFTAFAASEVLSSEDDPATGLRWHRVDAQPANLVGLPLYRRVLGRLTPDPVQLLPPSPTDDGAVLAALEQTLQEDPATADSDLRVRVIHGLAVLDGWLRTVGAKVMAERIARTSPGVWEAKNRLVSDEELAALARSHALADPRLAGAVARVTADFGRVTVRLAPSAGDEAERAARDLAYLPGCREVIVVRSLPSGANEKESH